MTMRVGVIGCGNISDIYLTNAPLFRDVAVSACADVQPGAAQRQAERYGIAARSVRDLLASDDVDIVLNLTIPDAHAEVSMAALDAGKHVYSEKPLATNIQDGTRIIDLSRAKGLRVGAAPDTVLGAGVREARRLIDAGAIGRPVMGVATFLSHGMEHWHPNPAFFFKPGGGPVFDMGPYYFTTLVTLLGPVASVTALGQTAFAERVVTTAGSAQLGRSIKVETPTTFQALLAFESGAQVTFLTSWDVWNHNMSPIDLHGTLGSMCLPDPNWFSGHLKLAEGRGEWRDIDTSERVYGGLNYPAAKPLYANYRGLGLAEMARAITDGRPHRASGDLALHVLAVMVATLESAREGGRVTIGVGCDQPAMMDESEAAELLAAG